MGWNEGSKIFETIITSVMSQVSDEAVRQAIYEPIIESFFSQDWDTEDECIHLDKAYKKALKKVKKKHDWL
jgi:hypothetical protein